MIEFEHDSLHDVNFLVETLDLACELCVVPIQAFIHVSLLEQLYLHLLPVELVLLQVADLGRHALNHCLENL